MWVVKKNQFSEILYYLICFGTLRLSELESPVNMEMIMLIYRKCKNYTWREEEFANHKKHHVLCGAKLCLKCQCYYKTVDLV